MLVLIDRSERVTVFDLQHTSVRTRSWNRWSGQYQVFSEKRWQQRVKKVNRQRQHDAGCNVLLENFGSWLFSLLLLTQQLEHLDYFFKLTTLVHFDSRTN